MRLLLWLLVGSLLLELSHAFWYPEVDSAYHRPVFRCPKHYGRFAHLTRNDRYWLCRYNHPKLVLCTYGKTFDPRTRCCHKPWKPYPKTTVKYTTTAKYSTTVKYATTTRYSTTTSYPTTPIYPLVSTSMAPIPTIPPNTSTSTRPPTPPIPSTSPSPRPTTTLTTRPSTTLAGTSTAATSTMPSIPPTSNRPSTTSMMTTSSDYDSLQ